MTIHTMKKVSLVVMLFLLQKSFDVTRRLAVLGVLRLRQRRMNG